MKEKDELILEVVDNTAADLLCEMASITKMEVPGNPRMKISVWEDEGRFEPHVHIFDKQGLTKGKGGGRIRKNEGFHTCVHLTRSAYFKHGPHQDNLSSDQQTEMARLMSLVRTEEDGYHNGIGKTNWQFAVDTWNDECVAGDYEVRMIPKGTTMPDYTAKLADQDVVYK